ncbi:MAG TPA: glycosyltransferase family A protein [Pyrinomonadaceae bacterium]|nr:glycosyltransferase family A protein [Pyrinomonadaceae bacterium]
MQPTAKPLISVVMPVYNALPFLDDSVNSILTQTFTDFEFVIFDDASTDGSVERLRQWAARDNRIKLHESTTQLGLSGSSNAVVTHARAAIVARMDADDVAHPDRLRRQWQIIETQPDVAVVGTLCIGIGANGREVRPRDRWRLLRRSSYIPFPHGSAMFRREVFDRVGGYDDTPGGEDQKLFSKMATQGRVVTLPDILYSYRYHTNNATLFNGLRAVGEDHSSNGESLAAFYMLGAMRLWAGEPPKLLEPLLEKKSVKWDVKSLMIFTSALWGHVSPRSLKLCLRGSIKVRDLLAGTIVKDGKPYEWRLE